MSNEIRISEEHSIEHKNGYWIYHTYSKSKKGKEYKSNTQTYANMLDMHHHAKLDGVCGEDVVRACQKLIDEAQKDAGRFIMKERAIKLKKESSK